MAGKMSAVTAATALVNMMELVCDRAIACYEAEDLFDPVYLNGLRAHAEFVAERVFSEPSEALASAQKRLRSVAAERDELLAERNAACDKLRAAQLEREELRAQRDKLQRRWDAIPRLQPRPMTAEDEPSGDSGQLPAEPYQWQVGDEVMRIDTITAAGKQWVVISNGPPSSQQYWQENGYKLHRKARDIKADQPPSILGELAAEPYQWQVGDEVIQDGIVWRITRESDGLVMPENCDGVLSQSGLESRGYSLHRKASEIEADEPWRAWKPGTRITLPGEGPSYTIKDVTDADAERWYGMGWREQSSVGTDVEGQS